MKRFLALVNSTALFLTLSWSLAVFAAAEPLPANRLLQKLSLKLRGKSPAAQELEEFRTQIRQNPERFHEIYEQKIASYLLSQEFQDVIEGFHAVWWRLGRSETTALARHIVIGDRPYLEIFDKDYLFINGARSPGYFSANAGTEEPLSNVIGDWRGIRLEQSEQRFRSIFSNLDFLKQYPDTPTNVNRKRSNYVFSTFLCEYLTPPPEPLHLTAPASDEHGSNPDCIGCHFRLDPMARFFDHWRPPGLFSDGAWYDINQEARGQVILREEDGSTRVAAGVGESDLGRILRSEPRVVQCIAKKAWEFIHGTGIKLDAQTHTDLTAAFRRRENFKDLLVQVVRHPYFWSTEAVPPLRFDDVKSNLSSCISCHQANHRGATPFDPQSYPFKADAATNFQLLKRIWGAVNRSTGFESMPPPPIPKLPLDVLLQLRDWISAGAIDNQGRATLNEAQISEVLDD